MKTKLALAAALVAALAVPALAETSDQSEYLANSGRWITQTDAGAFASMRAPRQAAQQKPMKWDAEKARFDRASEVH